MARRSADECSALLEDIEFILNLEPTELEPYYEQLRIIIVSLISLDRAMQTRAATQKKNRKTRPPNP